jgi:predicted helicase
LIGKSQCFPRYYYEPVDENQNSLFTQSINGYVRHDAVTDYILTECRVKYGPKITKDDIFYYVYGLLHSKEYRTTFSNDLKKSLPRLPLVDNKEDFLAFAKAGRDLAEIHLNYETVLLYPKVTIIGEDSGNFLVDKMRFGKDRENKEDKATIIYNNYITISGVPLKTYDYVVNGKSALEWVLERYQVKVDKDSELKNDPNDWAKERDDPRYILSLIQRIITVSLETLKIVDSLPKLSF